MNSQKLYEILEESTKVYRKGAEIQERNVGNLHVVEIFGYEHTSKAPEDARYEKVDMVFVDVVVDKEKATKRQEELEDILFDYPQPERLAAGPSYIELSPNCGLEQDGGLRLMALGKSLNLWEVISGKTFGFDEATTRSMAGVGLLMISGYRREKK